MKNLVLSLIAFALMTGFSTFAAETNSVETSSSISTNTVTAAKSSEESSAEKDKKDDKEKTALESWVGYIEQGGNTMIFLGLLSVLGLGTMLERAVTLRRDRIVPDGFSSRVVSLWKDNDFQALKTYCADSKSAIARVVEILIDHRDNKDAQMVKMFAEDKAGRELRLENRKSAMLGTVATIAPLLGLFGTVVGLLGAFQTVAAVGEMGDPAILAKDIGKALVTTVAGLAVSMPCLFVYNIIKNKLSLYAILLEEEVNDLINNIFVQK